MTATHPTDRELGEFLLGKLDDRGVESHLAECDSCRDRAVAVGADDTFTELLAAARTRFHNQRMSAPTPTLDSSATPPAFAPTLAWEGSTAAGGTVEPPAALAAHSKYRPIRRLGTGGMGTVWLAEHQVMHRPVAIKVIRPDLLARPGATNRFLREVRAAAKLHHPHIVTAFDADPAGDSVLLVMEYVPGETLGERLDSGPLPLVEALRAVRDAARGLAHAHAHGLIHRDVKPHNLIRSTDGTIKVLDFGLAGVGAGEGIAAAGDGLTGAGMVVGTPDYIAPEQIADPHAADARADVYGLGCTLYHLLAGRPPLPDGSVMEKLAAQRTRPMDPIPGLPTAVAAVLARMTAKDPNNRYQSADEVVAALERCIRMIDPARRRRRRVAAVALGLLVAGLLVAGGVVLKIQRDNQEITVATNDDDIEVVMKRKGDVLGVIDKKTGKEWVIDTANNEIAAADTPEGLRVKLPDHEPFVLRRNGRDVFTVTRITTAAAPAAAKPEASPPGGPRLVRTIDHRHPVRDIAWTPDGQSVVAVGGGLCRYDVVKGRSGFEYRYEVLSRLPGLKGNLNTEGPTQMVVSDDGQTAVIVYGNMLGQFSLADGKALGFQQLPEQDGKPPTVTALAVSPDGRTAVCAAKESLVFQDLGKDGRPEQVKLTAPGPVVGLRYSPDGGYLVATAAHPVGSRTEVIVLDTKTHQAVGRHTLAGMLGRVDIARDGKRLVAAGGVGDRGGFTVLTLPDLKAVQQEAEVMGFVEAARLSADGRTLTLERAPGAVEVWDVDRKVRVTDQPLPADPTSKGGDAPVRHVAIAADGRSVAVARGTEIGIWELPAAAAASPPAPQLVRTIEEEHRFPQTPRFTPDGRALLVAGLDYFAMYDPTTGKELFSDKSGGTQINAPVAVSADGQTAAVACGNVLLYDLAARKRVASIPGPEVDGKQMAVSALTLSPDGQKLAFVGGREVVYYDRATGQIDHTRPDDDKVRVFDLCYSPDGRYLAVASRVEADQSTRISLLNAKTRALVGRRETSSLSGATLQFSREGQKLFIAGTDLVRRTFLILAVASGNDIEREPDLSAGPEAPVPSPDGRLLAVTGTDGTVHVWDRGQKRVTFAWNPHTYTPPEFQPRPGRKAAPPRTGIAFSPDGRTLVTARGSQIRIWDLTPAPKAAPPADAGDPKLQGTWHSMSLTAVRTHVTFDGDRFLLRRTEKGPADRALPVKTEVDGTVHFEPAADGPRRFRVVETGGITRLLAIYRLEGDTLFLCVRKTGKDGDYPTKFATDPATGTELLILKKAAAEKPDRDFILGTWRGVAAEVNGQPMPPEFIDLMKPTLTFTADKVVSKPQGAVPKPFLEMAVSKGLLPKEAAAVVENGAEGVYHLDPAKSPREIDFTILGAIKKTALGIYRLDGDTLKLCLSIDPAKVAERPTEFASKAGEMRVLLTLRRLVPAAADRAAAEYVLSVGGTVRIDDQEKDIKAIGDLPKEPFRLTHVVLTDNRKVTDAGLAAFADCTNLVQLYLGKTAVTDAGLAPFKGCWNLADLELADTQVTDAGLAHFKDCANLDVLGVGETRVGDAGLAHLKDCQRLTNLMLNSSQVTDRGLAVVAGYKDLTHLSLQDTKVTDAGLKPLAGLTRLEELDLRQTKVTAAGVAELAKALPKCRIEWDGGHLGPPPKK